MKESIGITKVGRKIFYGINLLLVSKDKCHNGI